MSSSSGTSAPRTSLVACRIDARMIAPESMTVPSRSKRTTGKRMELMLAAAPSNPDRPGLDALDLQDRVLPGIGFERGANCRFALQVDDQQRVVAVADADGTA